MYVEEWTDIVKICADGAVTAGLKKDGTVVMAGHDYLGTHDAQNRSDIKDIALDYNIILGQRTDGSLIAAWDTGNINYLHTIHGAKNIGVEVHCVFWMYDNRIFYNGYDPLGFEAVFEWPNVKNYATDIKHLYAITEEGTLLYVGAPFEDPEGGLHGIKQNDA